MKAVDATCLVAIGVDPRDAAYLASKMHFDDQALYTDTISADFAIRRLARQTTGRKFDEQFCVATDNHLRYSRECDLINTICTATEVGVEFDDDL